MKPANLHLCRLGLRHDFVKVLDFGLVKAQRPEQLGDSGLETAAGAMPGTPAAWTEARAREWWQQHLPPAPDGGQVA